MVLVGIGGASCSGKSTVTNWISHYFRCPIIHQDRFYKPDSRIPHDENGVLNWDCPEAIDFDKFCVVLFESRDNPHFESQVGINRPKLDFKEIAGFEPALESLADAFSKVGANVVLVEGFLLYCNELVTDAIDVKIFLSASKEILKRRRELRPAYVIDNGTWTDPPSYFDQTVWPNYIEFNSNVINTIDNSAFIKIDSGAKSIGEILIECMAAILDSVQ